LAVQTPDIIVGFDYLSGGKRGKKARRKKEKVIGIRCEMQSPMQYFCLRSCIYLAVLAQSGLFELRDRRYCFVSLGYTRTVMCTRAAAINRSINQHRLMK